MNIKYLFIYLCHLQFLSLTSCSFLGCGVGGVGEMGKGDQKVKRKAKQKNKYYSYLLSVSSGVLSLYMFYNQC